MAINILEELNRQKKLLNNDISKLQDFQHYYMSMLESINFYISIFEFNQEESLTNFPELSTVVKNIEELKKLTETNEYEKIDIMPKYLNEFVNKKDWSTFNDLYTKITNALKDKELKEMYEIYENNDSFIKIHKTILKFIQLDENLITNVLKNQKECLYKLENKKIPNIYNKFDALNENLDNLKIFSLTTTRLLDIVSNFNDILNSFHNNSYDNNKKLKEMVDATEIIKTLTKTNEYDYIPNMQKYLVQNVEKKDWLKFTSLYNSIDKLLKNDENLSTAYTIFNQNKEFLKRENEVYENYLDKQVSYKNYIQEKKDELFKLTKKIYEIQKKQNEKTVKENNNQDNELNM